MAILDDVKTDLRITSADFNSEITSAIFSAKSRMSMAGVVLVDDNDPLTGQAIKLYCRSWFNFQGDAERYQKSFEALVNAMALSGDYGGVI